MGSNKHKTTLHMRRTIRHGKFLTKNPIISNRTTVGYYGIKQDPGRRTNLHLTGDLLDISHGGVRRTTLNYFSETLDDFQLGHTLCHGGVKTLN